MAPLPVWFDIMLAIGTGPVLLVLLKRLLNVEWRSLELRVIAISLFGIIGIAVLCFLVIDLWNNELLIIIIVFGPCEMLVVYATFYNAKSVKKSQDSLKNQIQISSDVSVNVANTATELAANASEVNASAEEIPATTQEVSQLTQDQAQTMMGINNRALNIKKIVEMITNIADQTNLLALNASIEAARA